MASPSSQPNALTEAETKRLHTTGFGGETIPCHCPVCDPEGHRSSASRNVKLLCNKTLKEIVRAIEARKGK